MLKHDFDPNQLCVPNGNYFGYPYTPEESDIILISVPWDVTTSYRPGTCDAPQAIIDASVQLDFYDFDLKNAWENKVGTVPPSETILKINDELREKAQKIIRQLEKGKDMHEPKLVEKLIAVNQGCDWLNNEVYMLSHSWLDKSKIAGVIGGDHSSPLGLIRALADIHKEFGILHIDAHGDLRMAYEGFEYSHASIMYNAISLESVTKLVQVGIRDVCQHEMELVAKNKRITCFTDQELSKNSFSGTNWETQCQTILNALPQKVYVSFDIDGLDPSLCPHTGTPVPGGLSFNQASYLIKKLAQSGKQIIGFDLCEVGPSDDEWDANVGARVLFLLVNSVRLSMANQS